MEHTDLQIIFLEFAEVNAKTLLYHKPMLILLVLHVFKDVQMDISLKILQINVYKYALLDLLIITQDIV